MLAEIKMNCLQLAPEDMVSMPWKNGRGTSHELAIWPQEAVFARGEGDWRIARASFREGGPFSRFEGYDRLLVVLAGEGLVLDHGTACPRRRLRRNEVWRFAGEWDTTAMLEGGPIDDLNILMRRGRAEGSLELLMLGTRRSVEALEPEHTFLHVVEGACRVRVPGEEEAFELGVGHSLWVHEAREGEECEVEGLEVGTRVAIARIRTPR